MARDLSPAASPEAAGLSSSGLTAIDAELRHLVDRGILAGAVTLAARHGRLAHTSTLGLKDIASGEPLKPDTLFRIYSMTKPVTAVAMMILWDEGLWSPDDTIARHLPEFADVKVFAGLGPDGKPMLEAPDHAPTLRELLTHTAGLSYGFNPDDPLDKLYQAADVWRSDNLAHMAAKIAGLPLAYQPGTKWLYSLSMDVQGAIIEKLSGQSLPAFMQSRIFGPLGMADTAFHTPPEKKARLATLYRKSVTRGLVPLERPLLPEHDSPPAVASGGGGLISTALDYARFAQMILNGGEFAGARIVSAEALKLMMTNQLSDALIAGGFGIGKQQIRPGFGYGFNGVVFTDPAACGIPVGQGTYHWDGAAGTWFWVDPVNDLIYVGLIQLMAEDSPACQAMTQTMMADAIL
jgi:CubicO group peptidase (beta-lactamase class C family)